MNKRREHGIARPSWHHHPAVRSADRLTLGERSADRLRNGMGSWGFKEIHELSREIHTRTVVRRSASIDQ